MALQHLFGGDMNVIAGDTERMKEGCERLFTSYLHSYSLSIHPTIAVSMNYCQYGKSCLFSMTYGLVLLYVKVGIGKVTGKSQARSS